MLKSIEKIAEMYNNDVAELEKALKRVQSAKCRLLPQKGRPDYEQKMREILDEEQSLKEAKNLLKPKKKRTHELTESDIAIMTYDEVMRAKNNIASKKTHTLYLTTVAGDNDEYRNAVKVENMLNERLKHVKPVEDTVVRKSDIQLIIDTIRATGEMSSERIIEMLQNLI